MLSIIVPVYQGKATLRPLADAITGTLSMHEDDWELLFIDDGSTDGSPEVLRELSSGNSRIGWISFKRNRGQQPAVLCGLRESRGDYVITMDDDLEHPVEFISRLSAEILKGYDAVYAVPEGGGSPGGFLRDVFFSIVMKKPADLRIGSFRIFTREAAAAISKTRQPFVYISAELFRRGFSASSITYRPRENNRKSRYRFSARLNLYLRLLAWYTPFPGAFLRAAAVKAGKVQYEISERGGCLC